MKVFLFKDFHKTVMYFLLEMDTHSQKGEGDFNFNYYCQCVEECIDNLPLLRILIPKCASCSKSSYCYIFGGFLRWLVETNGKKGLHEFFKTGADIDLCCRDPETLITFLQGVAKNQGYVEYFGNHYGAPKDNEKDTGKDEETGDLRLDINEVAQKIDLLKKENPQKSSYHTTLREIFPDGNYSAYIPHNDSWIKYDISFEIALCGISTRELDFTVNGLTYPKSDAGMFALAVADIRAMRIQPYKIFGSPKYLFRAKKLLGKGYKFDNDSTCSALYIQMKNFVENDGMIYVGDTNIPSIMDAKHHIIRTTKHKKEEATWDSVLADETLSKMCDTSFIDMHIKTGIGKLDRDLHVFKSARLIRSQNVIDHGDNNVVVCLKVTKGTTYHCASMTEGLKMRFESAFVESILSYPNNEMLLNEGDKVVSFHDPSFQYHIGEHVYPTHPFDFTPGACSFGIHAFFNTDLAWRYQSLHHAYIANKSQIEKDVWAKFESDKTQNVCDQHSKSSPKTPKIPTTPTSKSPSKRSSKKKSPKKDNSPEKKPFFYNSYELLATLKKK